MNTDGIAREDLREATLTGVRWVAFGRVIAELAAFASSVVLARLIAPAEFGVFAVTVAFQAIGIALAVQGFGSPLVQRESLDRTHVEVATLLSLVAGAAMTGIVFLLGPAAAPLFGERTAEMIQLVSPVFFLSAVGAVPSAMLQRRLEFKRVTTAEIVSVIGGICVSVGLALAGLNAEALVAGVLARSGLASVLLLAGNAVLPRWNSAAAKETAAFGAQAAGASMGYTGFRNVDYAIVGAQLGAAQVGLYWRSYQLAFEYPRKITAVMQRLAFPVLSRSRDIKDMVELRFRIVRVHSVVIYPVLFMLIALAPVAVPWLYGSHWEPAVLPAQLLAVGALAVPMITGLGALLLAAGQAGKLMSWTWFFAGAYAAVILFTASHGLTAVCLGVVGYQLVKFFVSHHFLLYRLMGITLRDLWREAAPGLVAGVALLAAAYPLQEGLVAAGVPPVLVLGSVGSIGLAVYLLVLRLGFAGAWADLELLLRRLMPTKRVDPPRARQVADATTP